MKTMNVKKASAVSGRRLFAMATSSAVVVTTKGRPAWAIVPIPEDQDLEDFVTSNSRTFWRIIEKSLKSYKQKGGISHQEVKRRFGIK